MIKLFPSISGDPGEVYEELKKQSATDSKKPGKVE